MEVEKEDEIVVLGRQSVASKKSRFIVNMVNPRFQNYSRPLLLAITVGLLTFLLMICTFIMVMSVPPKQTQVDPIKLKPEVRTTTGTCTTVVTYPQQTGPYQLIRALVGVAATPTPPITDKNVDITITTDLCLVDEVKLTLYHGEVSIPFHDTQGVIYYVKCLLPDEFILGQGLVKGEDAAQHCNQWESWCWTPPDEDSEDESAYVFKYCEGMAERYTVYSHSSGGFITGISAIKAEEDYHEKKTTCPPLDNHYGAEIPWLVTFNSTVKTCVNTTTVVPEIPGVDGYNIEGKKPTFEDSLGTAFAYASYFEIAVTVLVVQSLLRCGCLKTAMRVVPDWA